MGPYEQSPPTPRARSARFPDGFDWSVSTAAFLMEGAPYADGSGPSVQHTYTATPGNGPDLHRGVLHYDRMDEDLGLVRDLGVRSFRFSLPWARILPEGTGTVNQAGLDHYDRMVDTLLEYGVTPFPYLHEWDLPAALQDRGGWANRDCAWWFADYAAVVFDRLADRVPRWLTICEPWSIVHFGHLTGDEAPGIRDLRTALRVGHHLLLGHGLAVRMLRADHPGARIGLSTVRTAIRPASDHPTDQAAAERADLYLNRLLLDPVLLGHYPDPLPEPLVAQWPEVTDEDLAVIRTPIDFLGLVYYLRMTVTSASTPTTEPTPDQDRPDGPAGDREELPPGDLVTLERHRAVFAELLDVTVVPTDEPVTRQGWVIAPEGLAEQLRAVAERYRNPPVYVAETGADVEDSVHPDGTVDDPDRVRYLTEHLRAAHTAIQEGVDLRGWSVWSLLDDPSSSFGLVRVEPDTLRRVPRTSYAWYRRTIAANRLDG